MGSARPAQAQTPPPVYSVTRYVNDLVGGSDGSYDRATMYGWGCDDANADPLTGGAALDFAAPWQQVNQYGNAEDGVWNFSENGLFLNDEQVLNAVEGYVEGWFVCDVYYNQHQKQLGLAISVSNCGAGYDRCYDAGGVNFLDSPHGNDWALSVVMSVETYIRNYSYQGYYAGNYMAAGAGLDAEPNWNSYGATLAWESGYLGGNCGGCYTLLLGDFGSANGCPTSGTGPGNPGGCANASNGWNQSTVLALANGCATLYCGYVWSVPEIYSVATDLPPNGGDAAAWQQVALWGCDNGPVCPLGFSGTLTQWRACVQVNGSADCTSGIDRTNLPGQGWTDLYNAMTCNGTSPCPTNGGAPGPSDSDICKDHDPIGGGC